MAQAKKAARSIGAKKKKAVLSKKAKSFKNKSLRQAPQKQGLKSSSKKTMSSTSGAEGWPIKRNVLFRPERLQYIRKMIKYDGCVFCRSANESASVETLCVYKSKYSQVVLNKFPYNTGHMLILPLRHTGDILNLSETEYIDLQLTLKKAIEAVQKVYEPNAFNIGLNHGVGGGAGIPDHLHYHIVPRWHGDLNFFPLIAETKVVVETLDDSYKKLAEYFAQNKGEL